MAKKYCQKFQPLSRAHEHCRRQTDLQYQRPECNVVTFGQKHTENKITCQFQCNEPHQRGIFSSLLRQLSRKAPKIVWFTAITYLLTKNTHMCTSLKCRPCVLPNFILDVSELCVDFVVILSCFISRCNHQAQYLKSMILSITSESTLCFKKKPDP